jgi:isoleucyl-tRNA synthetase
MSKLHGRENDTVAVDTATPKSEVALREETIQAFWVEHDIFHKSITTPAGSEPKGDFVFYDGPPFATGTPHYGHILAGTIKDAIPRFWTMQGYRVRRKWGWDCHGLPLENLIEKKLGLATKRDIETYGVKNFNEAACGAVMEYADEWAKVVPRMGRWADMEHDYKTMDSTYTESVWWVFSELNKKGLVYEGFKSMHLCPRCGTTLSNFEVNQGYKDIKDIAVTVKLPLLDEAGNATDTSLLVWTTTPWTLPGNMAAAVHQDFEYVKVKLEEGYVVLAKGRLAQLGDTPHEVVETMKGTDLVGRSYQPPFDYWQKQDFEGKDKAWKIYHADYVELGEEGTGAVHLAPAYGDEDMQLAKVYGVPIMHHVDGAGHFLDFVTDFAGQLVKPKDDDEAGVDHKAADIEVLKKLQEMGKVFKKENITHSYPHCWRCDTPLLNYATTSWFVNVSKIKDELVVANNTVNWVPDHVGTNRFGRWLEGARDWAVSRQRYWGAPLPIWKNPVTGDYKVFGSKAELLTHTPKRSNQYFIVRHAQAESNLSGVINALPGTENPLTEAGRAQCEAIAASLKDKGITKIVHSGLQRGRETAERVAASLGLSPEAVVEDGRVIEYQAGVAYEGKTWEEFNANFVSEAEKFTKELPGAERRRDLIKRVGEFLYEFDATHQNENVLIVGHGSSIFALQCAAEGADMDRTLALKEAGYFGNGELKELPFTPLPHNDYYELDYHRPYIDDFEVVDTDGTRLVRVPDVFDCWFESGSMPYGQHHYPFSCGDEQFGKEYFPAQFIAEGLDQTRGWFYSLIVLGTALFGKSPYEHVIVNGLVLAEDGKKMSKKLQNYPDPMELASRVGADAMRYYLLTSPVVRGEDLSFSEKEVLELQRKNIGRLHNVLAMYELFKDGTAPRSDSSNVLDRWIVSRLNQLVSDSEAGYRAYELDRATRPIADFIDDLSVWYLRRSRDRLKGDDLEDKALALATLRYALRELALVMAPVMPFYAEYLWQAVKEDADAESVHLGAWPKGGEVEQFVVETMETTRSLVTAALEQRTKLGIKVRQPLRSLTVPPELPPDYADILADEVNVKDIFHGAPVISLDTVITPELLAEGYVRELMRGIQERRKTEGLEPHDRIVLTLQTSSEGEALVNQFQETIMKTVGAAEVVFGQAEGGITLMAGEHSFIVALSKIS